MAIKIKRRKPEAPEEAVAENTESPESDAPAEPDGLAAGQLPVPLLAEDPVYTRTWSLFTWMESNRNLVLAGIGGVLALLAVAGMVVKSRTAAAEESSQRLFAALDMAAASADGSGSVYGSVQEREAALGTAAGVVASSEGGQVAGLANLLVGRAALMNGDTAAATSAFEAGAAALPGPESGYIAISSAAAQAAGGDLAGALSTLDTLASVDASAAYAARRQAALLTDTWGEPRAALEAWREVVTEHPGAPGIDAAINRVAQLEIALGVEPVAVEPAAEGSADAQPADENAP